MIKHHYILLFILSLFFIVSCDETKVNIEQELSTAVEHSEPTFFPNVKGRFGEDVTSLDNITIKSNKDGITLECEVTLTNGEKENRTTLLSNEEMKGFVKKVTKNTPLDINWTTSDDVEIDLTQNDSSRSKVIMMKKAKHLTSEGEHDLLFKSEIEDAVFLEHQEKVKSINTLNVSIENGITNIEADVLLENGETVKQMIKRKSDKNFSIAEGKKEIKVKMIEIENK